MKDKNKTKENTPVSQIAKEEEAILEFWDKAETFKRSVEKDAPNGDYVFYDGPPFGTGEPHYGHILSSVSKDVVPRFWTMKGYRVERRWGWDCHGLPIENIIEKEMNINGKKQIEEMGIAKFNEACRSQVLKYADIWDVMVRRIGRWVDFKNSYKTMDTDFMESVWWGFGELWKKGLVYEGRRVLLYCPRCETPISNFEVAMDNSYKDIEETSVYVKFTIKNEKLKIKNLSVKDNEAVYILAWTTTPWTLPGNVALAVGKSIKYQILSIKGEDNYYIVAEERVEEVFKNKEYEIIKEIKGKDLIGLEYEPLFDVPALKEAGKDNTYKVAVADFVTTDDGTGVVHTAVVYGEDDYNLGKELDLPVIPALDEKGHFNETVPAYESMYFKKANKKIIEDLKENNLLFKEENIIHSYPHCHRCDTQLFYNAIPAWFINIAKLRDELIAQNKNINWYPKHLKEGRFQKGLENAPDWNISRNRYFATPMPIWKCEKCEKLEVISSIKSLEERSGTKGITDIHSHFIDDKILECKCGGKMKRISEVFDCWVESGSMTFAEHHYMGKALPRFDPEKGVRFPAQYISEYISQTRAWFYVMHVMSVALFSKNSYENVVSTGVILNEAGQKMSKSKKNYPDPWKVINEYGVDALRYYLMSSTIMHSENLFFNERELRDVTRKTIMLLSNVFRFYKMFSTGKIAPTTAPESKNILDKWIISRLYNFINEVDKNMGTYDLPRASRPIIDFIDDLSTWYVRRSRGRFKGDDKKDKEQALDTFGFVLLQLSKTMAPFMPFISEKIYQAVTGQNYNNNEKSVHLEKWPKAGDVNEKVLEEMTATRKIVELGLAKRDEAGIKVRQVLSTLTVVSPKTVAIKNAYIELIKDEVNVKEVKFKGTSDEISVELDIELTPELKREGLKRELVRLINAKRKNTGLTINDRINVAWKAATEVKEVIDLYYDELLNETLANKFSELKTISEEEKKDKLNEFEIVLQIEKQ
jgi:isoleucyl-tRNA synthetase